VTRSGQDWQAMGKRNQAMGSHDDMGNFNFNLKIAGLGLLFLLSIFAPLPVRDELIAMHFIPRIGVAIVAAAPLWMTFYLIWRRMQVLAHDEYQRHRLQQQLLYASTYSVCTAAVLGFVNAYDPQPSQTHYITAIVFWYGGWFSSAIVTRDAA
jgi:hypothetical protein